MPRFPSDSPFVDPAIKRAEAAIMRAEAAKMQHERLLADSTASVHSGPRYAQDRHLLQFKMRKDEDAEAALLRCLPSFWEAVRTKFDANTAHSMKPLGYSRTGQIIMVAASADDSMMSRLRKETFLDNSRRARIEDLHQLDEAIPQSVLDAVHLATWPQGPAAVEAMLAELDKLESKADADRMVTTIPPVKGIMRDVGHRLIITVPHDRSLKGNRQRFNAARTAADMIRRTLLQEGIQSRIQLLGVRDMGDGVHVAIACSGIAGRALRQSSGHGLRILTLKDPAMIDVSLLSAIQNEFDKVLLKKEVEPAKRSTFLRPASYMAAVKHGLTIHGFVVITMIWLWLIGFISISSGTSILALAGLMNVVAIPAFRRWAIPAASCTRALGSAAGAGMQKACGTLTSPRLRLMERTSGELDRSWSVLANLCGSRADDVAASKRSCDRFSSLASTHAVRVEAAETSATIGSMIPQLAADLGHIVQHADQEEREAAIERVVQALKRIAANADAARDGLLQGARDRLSTTISFIEAKSSSTPLTAITDDSRKGTAA